MFSNFWFMLSNGSANLLPAVPTGSDAVDGALYLPS